MAYHNSQSTSNSTYDHQGVILKSALNGKSLRIIMGLPVFDLACDWFLSLSFLLVELFVVYQFEADFPDFHDAGV